MKIKPGDVLMPIVITAVASFTGVLIGSIAGTATASYELTGGIVAGLAVFGGLLIGLAINE